MKIEVILAMLNLEDLASIFTAENNAALAHYRSMVRKFEKERQFPAVRPGLDSQETRWALKRLGENLNL
jgi:hypothetical protein